MLRIEAPLCSARLCYISKTQLCLLETGPQDKQVEGLHGWSVFMHQMPLVPWIERKVNSGCEVKLCFNSGKCKRCVK